MRNQTCGLIKIQIFLIWLWLIVHWVQHNFDHSAQHATEPTPPPPAVLERFPKHFRHFSLAPDDPILATTKRLYVQGKNGPVTPYIIHGFPNQQVRLIGTSDACPVILKEGENLNLNGLGKVTLGEDDFLALVYDNEKKTWLACNADFSPLEEKNPGTPLSRVAPNTQTRRIRTKANPSAASLKPKPQDS
jgi:hypothetical protein